MKQAISYLEIAIDYAVIALRTHGFDLSAVKVGFAAEKVTQVSL
jgi:hypothetical protein